MNCLAVGFVCFLSAGAAAQTAQVRVTHDDANGVALPGESIRVIARLSWPDPAFHWGGLKGALIATADLGVASMVGSQVLAPTPLTQIGSPRGGSVAGFDVAFVPAYFTGGNIPQSPAGNWFGIDFVWFTWQAPAVSQPTVVEFHFTADPIAPNVRLFHYGSPAPIEAQTTYVGASILVLPAPGGAAVLAVAMIGAGGWRRRG